MQDASSPDEQDISHILEELKVEERKSDTNIVVKEPSPSSCIDTVSMPPVSGVPTSFE